MIDVVGPKQAQQEIAMIKVAAPRMALRVVDRAIQAHGGGGVSQDHVLAHAYAGLRSLRLADGPDEVHCRTVASRTHRAHEVKALRDAAKNCALFVAV
jgi:alkylation response protein AidB-like acyl-CoA dehydrogenase